MLTLLVVASLLLVTLAGCFSGGGEEPRTDLKDPKDNGLNETNGDNVTPEPPTPALPRLSEFTCDLNYPDNETSLPCENEFYEAEMTVSPPSVVNPDGWTCVEQYSEDENPYILFWVYWNPDKQKHGIYWEVMDEEYQDIAVNGVIYSRQHPPERVQTVSWSDGGRTGFAEFPEINDGSDTHFMTNRIYIRFYTIEHESPDPVIQDADIRVLWSFYENHAYPLVSLETENGTYYFDERREVEFETAANTYHLVPFTVEGEDFELTVTALEQRALGYGWRDDPRVPWACPELV